MDKIINKQAIDRVKEIEFLDIFGSLVRNAEAITTKCNAVIHTYKELDAEQYALMCDTMIGHLNRLNSLVDNDLGGKFRELTP